MNNTIAYYIDKDKSLLFLGRKSFIQTTSDTDLDVLQSYLDKHNNSYKAIALSYDLKNAIYSLDSHNNDRIRFPNIICWEPEHVIQLRQNKWTVLQSDSPAQALQFAHAFEQKYKQSQAVKLPFLNFQATIDKEMYLNAVKEVQQEIQYGNTYEVNYCQEFYASNIPPFDSFALMNRLYQITKAPFSAYLQFDEWEVFCGSPERFLKKENSHIFSQPIKGTIARSTDPNQDEANIRTLQSSKKDYSENVMIVDLVRNDLAQIATKGSVHVEELAQVHSFETVHHLISTISCELKPQTSFVNILKATFPMGSMTGAPKLSTMQISERLEAFKRGIYSGSIGYFEPNGNFDLNVVIRSFVKNNATQTISCGVGGAITIQSIPENEYDECLAKVGKILAIFSSK